LNSSAQGRSREKKERNTQQYLQFKELVNYSYMVIMPMDVVFAHGGRALQVAKLYLKDILSKKNENII